jgi:hypothetical protein
MDDATRRQPIAVLGKRFDEFCCSGLSDQLDDIGRCSYAEPIQFHIATQAPSKTRR